EEIGALVDQDVVARHLVAVAVDARVFEQLDLAVAVVDLDAQGLAVDPGTVLAFLRILPLPETHRVAGGGRGLITLGILAHDDALGAHQDRPLAAHHVALEDVHASRVVGAQAVGFDLRRFVPVRLFGPGDARRRKNCRQPDALHGAFFGSKRPRTSAFRVNWRDSVLYSMPRPLNELRSSTIVTSGSVRRRARAHSSAR